MNAIRHLLKDHEEVGKLFNQFVDVGEEAHKQKQTIAEQVIKEITMNAELEDEILFPLFAEKGGEEAQEIVQEGMEEHYMLEFMMDRLKKTRPEDKTFNAKFKALMESTKHHFMEEEREIFPKAKKVLKGELDRLGEEMDALEKQMSK
jgi:hemerythrin-like domain-containing protein